MKYSANSVWENKDEYDVAVVGAGHAGCEAALATARLGFKTVMFTVSVDSIAEAGESGYPADGSNRASDRRREDYRCTDLFRCDIPL